MAFPRFYNFSIRIGFLPYKSTLLSLCGPQTRVLSHTPDNDTHLSLISNEYFIDNMPYKEVKGCWGETYTKANKYDRSDEDNNNNNNNNLTSGSESQQRKVKLMCVHSKRCNYRESLHKTTKPVFVPMRTSLVAVIFIS